ncbi:PstS family phosphate ABC transporter substrate-binding protein [Oscillatoria sp. CS-180]|uniref:PstS family phosphate ABC transporter substrate-binding protein n=1 Tax=Oscillatoria sp. CS-180 TaxID=3021720 RepID=UPI00232DD6E6|nr:PstS family phosphate ABC transporter substrate-binding protein [Oscillatoria sp. CS-180]MDB9525299.1 PstS family phosphate ABC transporter substrate-binding protein [Oscillatoria sp. CS-180]
MTSRNKAPLLLASFAFVVLLAGGVLGRLTYKNNFGLSSVLGSGTSNASTETTSTLLKQEASSTGDRFSDIEALPSGTFSYGGSTTWAPVRSKIDTIMQQAQPEFRLRYVEAEGAVPGSETGIQMLLRNELSFAQSSRPLKAEERYQAQEKGYILKEIPVAVEGIAIAVNNDLPIQGLTLEELKGIYTGELTNWNQLGGPDLKIEAISRPLVGGTVEFFVNTVLDSEELPAVAQVVDSTTEGLRRVEENAGAIFYASSPEVVGQCSVKAVAVGFDASQLVRPYLEPYIQPENCPEQRNQINRAALRSGEYPLMRQLFVIVREDGMVDQKAGEAYVNLLLTEEGKDMLNEIGFVAIR